MRPDKTKPQDRSLRSDISCHHCRKRKVRCDRGFPQCSVCEQTAQVCNYPPGPLKPGPKIGSMQRPRKRLKATKANDDGKQQAATERSPRQENSAVAGCRNSSTDSPYNTPSTHEKGSSSSDRGRDSPASIELDEWNASSRNPRFNMHDLSFVLHPSHEASTPEKEQTANSSSDVLEQEEPLLMVKACYALGLTQGVLEQMVRTYFDNMVAINLFHEPTFRKKINSIVSPTHVYALLAAMIAYAVRFHPAENGDMSYYSPRDTAETHLRAAHFLNLALNFVDKALKECGDEAPPLCILQAVIIAAHCQLTQGVRGKAWRSLGTCVRLAYELNLHLVDAGGASDNAQVDLQQWSDDEEKRRAWWAVWEMDVYGTTIRRTPTAVDWSQIETLLPVEDEYWFQNKPRPSCFLESDPIYRWKALQNCGNKSPKAWYIVINSLMKEAQKISCPRGVPYMCHPTRPESCRAADRRGQQKDLVEEARQKLEILANSVQCFSSALPAELRYHSQYLGFDARVPGETSSLRQLHCSIYNIYIMTQLSKLMIYRYDVLGEHTRLIRPIQDSYGASAGKSNQHESRQASVFNMSNIEGISLRQYFEAADNILTIVLRSCEDHVQYINPFLPSTIWLASAVQLVHKEFCKCKTSRDLVKSKFEVLHLAYKRCVSFWDIQTAMQQNLELLEAQLEGCYNPSSDKGYQRRLLHSEGRPNGRGDTSEANTGIDCNTLDSRASDPPHNNLKSPSPSKSDATSQKRVQQQQHVSFAQKQQNTAAENIQSNTSDMSLLDFMHLPPQLDTAGPTPATSPDLIDPIFLDQTQTGALSTMIKTPDFGQTLDWRDMELPHDIYSLLSGAFPF